MAEGPPPGLGDRPSLSFAVDRFIKTQAPALARIERQRTDGGREVGRASRLFLVPGLEAYDDVAGSLEFERLHGMRPLHLVLQDPRVGSRHRLLRHTGRILAAIHDRLEPADGVPVIAGSLGPGVRSRPVPLHGDFSVGNVLYSPEQDRYAVIDWSVALWLGEPPGVSVGPAVLDLGVFLISLFHSLPLGSTRIPGVRSLAREFLASYGAARITGAAPDDAELCQLLPPLVARFARARRARWGLRALAYRPSLWGLMRFIRAGQPLGAAP